MLDWVDLIARRDKWVAHNFPDQKSNHESVFGCMEEVGELAHAHLKELQAIRGTAEEHQANAKDAIGDLIVYLLGIMSRGGYKPRPVTAAADSADSILLWLGAAVGTLAKNAHSPAYSQQLTIDYIVHHAEAYCTARGWDFGAIVMGTWEAVETRDWIAWPNTGRPPEQGDFGLAEQATAKAPLYKEGDRIKLTMPNGRGGQFQVERVDPDGTTHLMPLAP